MPRKSSRNADAKRVSSEKHEIRYTGSKIAAGRRGTTAVKKAKKALGRTTSRNKVERKARALA